MLFCNVYSRISLFQVRISKLVDIWDRGSTFPSTMLSGFRQKLTAPPQDGKIVLLSNILAKENPPNRICILILDRL